MNCPRCKAALDERACYYGDCMNTNSLENLDEIYEDYYCTCPSCGCMFIARETFVYTKCEVKEFE